MKLSIIVPVYNEEKTITQVLEKLIKVALPCQKEIIIVDDGSTDGTRKQITDNIKQKTKALKTPRRWPAHKDSSRGFIPRDSSEVEEPEETLIKVITHNHNLGKGAAVRSGIKKAIGDYLLIQDADLEYNPEEIPKLLSPILSTLTTHNTSTEFIPSTVEGLSASSQLITPIAVYGSRFKNNQAIIPPLYLLGNKFLTFLTNFLYGTKLSDMETGYKLLPAAFLKKMNLQSTRFDIEPEITIKLVKKRIPIIEIPISYKGRSHFAGKKLTLRDAFGAVKTLMLFWLKSRHR